MSLYVPCTVGSLFSRVASLQPETGRRAAPAAAATQWSHTRPSVLPMASGSNRLLAL